MATISMALNTGDEETTKKLTAVRGWMQSESINGRPQLRSSDTTPTVAANATEKNVPKSFQLRVMTYCNEIWSNRAGQNVDELFADVPPCVSLPTDACVLADR